MNILYINHYAGSLDMGMEFRPFYLAREWQKMGHKVRIVAADYSHLRKVNPVVKKDFDIQTIEGIEYQWIKTSKYQGNGMARAKTMMEFCTKLHLHARTIVEEFHPNLVIASSTYPLDTYPAQRIAHIGNCKYYHEVHDMWPSTLYEVGGMSRHNPFVVLMQIAENSAYSNCDKCISLLPFAESYMKKHGLKDGCFLNIQNGIVESDWENYETIPDEHRKLFEELQDKFVVGYFGGHAISNALDKCLDVAKNIKEKGESDIHFVFVGDGVEKQRLVERAEKESISNVHFLPPVSKRAVPDLLHYFDCSYMSGLDSPLYRFGLCLNKMYDSMMAGIPIVCAFNAPDTLVRTYNCGYQCDPSDEEGVVQSILNIKNMSIEDRKQLGDNGKKAILNSFTFRRLAEEFLG